MRWRVFLRGVEIHAYRVSYIKTRTPHPTLLPCKSALPARSNASGLFYLVYPSGDTEMTTPSTVFKKGEKRPNQGKRGPNKVNSDIKAMILEALSSAGGAEYLERKANDPRTAAAFLGLVGKVLPMTIANADGKGFVVTVIERRIVNASHPDA